MRPRKEQVFQKVNFIVSNLTIACVYAITGYFGLLLAVPPGYATVIWPPAGIALASLLIFGSRTLPGIFLGSFLINLYMTIQNGQMLFTTSTFIIAALIGVGAILQAYGGSRLIIAVLGPHNSLFYPRDILLFALLSGPVSCVINASSSVFWLYQLNVISSKTIILNWSTWWIGDSISVLIFTPIMLILFARPRSVWQPRLSFVLIPLSAIFLLVMLAYVEFSKAELNRVRFIFSRQVNNDLWLIKNRIDAAQLFTTSFANYLMIQPDINQKRFSDFALMTLQNNNYIQAIEWVPRDRKTTEKIEKSNFVQFLMAEIANEKPKRLTETKNAHNNFPLRFVAPFSNNEIVVGAQLNSPSERQQTVRPAYQTNSGLMTAPITIDPLRQQDKSLLVYAPVQQNKQFLGFALSVINLEKLLTSIPLSQRTYYELSLQDVTNPHDIRTIYEYRNPKSYNPRNNYRVDYSRTIELGGRLWEVNAISALFFGNTLYSWQVWTVYFTALILTLLMNIIIFTLYGQKRIIQNEVRIKTLALNVEKNKNLLLLQSAGEGIYGLDELGCLTFINNAACKMLGYSAEELVGKVILPLIQPRHFDGSPYPSSDNPVSLTFKEGKGQRITDEIYWRKNGSFFWVEYNCTPIIKNQRIMGVVVIFSDITARRAADEKLLYLARHDTLTNIPNRLSFLEHLPSAIIRSQRSNKVLAVCFIDLDNFKHINDSLGHQIGDEIIRLVPTLFQPALSENIYMARLGGDEFVLTLEEIDSIEAIENIMRSIYTILSKPYVINSIEINVRMSIGIAVYPTGGSTPEELIKNADIAMYQAKEQGKNTYVFFNKKTSERTQRRHIIDVEMRNAIKNHELYIHYQPQYTANDPTCVGLEALVRWKNPILDTISPTEFIPIAEDTGFIQEIGEWVLNRACSDYLKILRVSPKPLSLSVNVSAKQLEHKQFISTVQRIIQEKGVPPQSILFEITETALVQRPEHTAQVINQLRAMGIKFMLDDFGVGYSSMQYLKSLPISFIKIDKSFIQHVTESDNDAAIVLATIKLSQALGLQTIAEGVETLEQLYFLQSLGCNQVQGFYLAKPLTLEDLLARIRNDELSPSNALLTS